MSVKVIVGAQWGDEGKGKIVDIMAEKSDVTVRFQGGDNAGHTVNVGGEQFKLSVVPSGILYQHNICIIGAGVVLNPKILVAEMNMLKTKGIPLNNLKIDFRAHLVMPYHIAMDGLSENKLLEKNGDIGTTKKGIGPAYVDKAARTGIRVCDLLDAEVFADKVNRNLEIKNKIIQFVYDSEPLKADAIVNEYLNYVSSFREHITDTIAIISDSIKAKKNVLLEGAQGALLDIVMGTYPYVTSSHTVAGGACVGSGVGPTLIDECIGVVKAYVTRVGNGPFPTEMDENVAKIVRSTGCEFGTVTGRPRKCGWFDGVAVCHSVMINSLTSVIVNKLDTLSGIKVLKICIGYDIDGSVMTRFPAYLEQLDRCKPIYEELEGWDEDLSGIREFKHLPHNAQRYIKKIEEICDVPVSTVGVGPERQQSISVIE